MIEISRKFWYFGVQSIQANEQEGRHSKCRFPVQRSSVVKNSRTEIL